MRGLCNFYSLPNSFAHIKICVRDLKHSLCKFVRHYGKHVLLACKGFISTLVAAGDRRVWTQQHSFPYMSVWPRRSTTNEATRIIFGKILTCQGFKMKESNEDVFAKKSQLFKIAFPTVLLREGLISRQRCDVIPPTVHTKIADCWTKYLNSSPKNSRPHRGTIDFVLTFLFAVNLGCLTSMQTRSSGSYAATAACTPDGIFCDMIRLVQQ